MGTLTGDSGMKICGVSEGWTVAGVGAVDGLSGSPHYGGRGGVTGAVYVQANEAEISPVGAGSEPTEMGKDAGG